MGLVKAGALYVLAALLWIAGMLWSVLGFCLFIVVNLLGGLVERLLRLVAAGGLFVALFFALFMRTRTDPIVGGAVLAFGATALIYGIQALRRALAPAGMVIISEV